MAVLHLGEDEGVAAGAVLHVVLLALWADRSGQQVGQVGKGQGQQAAHVRGKRAKREGGKRFLHLAEQRSGSSEFPLWSSNSPLSFSVSCSSAPEDFSVHRVLLCFITFSSSFLAGPPLCWCIQKSSSAQFLLPLFLMRADRKHRKSGLRPILTPTLSLAHAAQSR